MTRKRFSEEGILGILRQIELELASGVTVETAIRTTHKHYRVDSFNVWKSAVLHPKKC